MKIKFPLIICFFYFKEDLLFLFLKDNYYLKKNNLNIVFFNLYIYIIKAKNRFLFPKKKKYPNNNTFENSIIPEKR